MQPLTSEQVPGYSDAFLQGMQKALAVRPQDRPQSIAELRSLLGLSAENRAAPAPVEPSPSPIYIPITTPAAVQAAMASESASAQAPRFLPITETYVPRSEEHTSELQSPCNLVCRLLLEKKKNHRAHVPAPDHALAQHRPPLHRRRARGRRVQWPSLCGCAALRAGRIHREPIRQHARRRM